MKKTKTFFHRKVIAYTGVGLCAFLVEYGCFVILHRSGSVIIVAQTVSFIAGLLVSFLGNRLVTFNDRKDYSFSSSSQLWRYSILAVLNLVLTNWLIHLLVDRASVNPYVAKVIVMASVVIWNYAIYSKYIFKNDRKS